MLICHKEKFIYYAPPRTGTTTFSNVLEEEFGAYMYAQLDFGTNEYARHDVGLPEKYDHYFTFASVRNPYDRVISAYNWTYRNADPVPVEEVMTDPPLMRPIWDSIFDNEPILRCIPVRLDAFVRLENLEEDFSKLPFVKKSIVFPKLNSSPTILEKLTEKQIAYVNKHYSKDFSYFGYTKIKPHL